MASVDPITPLTISAVAAITESLSPDEPNVTPLQADLPSLSPTSRISIMDSSTIPADVSLSIPQQQSLNDAVIKSEVSVIATPLKRPRHKPEERKELLEKAVRDVKEQKISMRKAASRYNIAKSSLCDYVRKNHIILPNNRCKPSATASASALTSANNSNGEDYHNQQHPPYFDTASAGVAEIPQTSAALQMPRTSTQSASFNLALETAGLLRTTHAVTPSGASAGCGSVLSRLESPWNNVSGLPTQVPMQNWSSLAAQARSVGSLSQPSAVPSPKQTESFLGFNAESNSSVISEDFTYNNGGNVALLQVQQPSTVTFTTTPSSTSPFICPSLANDVLKNIPHTAPFFAFSSTTAPPPPFAVTSHFASPAPHLLVPPPPPPSLQIPTSGTGGEALIPTPLSRSLASIYAPTPPLLPSSLPPMQQPPPLPSVSKLPVVFPPTPTSDVPYSSEANMVVDSLHRLLLAATEATARNDAKHLLPVNFGDLILDLPSPMGFPTPAANPNPTMGNALLQKLQLPNHLKSLIGASSSTLNASLGPVANGLGGSAVGASGAAAVSRLPETQLTFAKELISFINRSPSSFHVVRSATEMLTANGFRELSENEPWKLAPNDCVFITKNHSSLFAIAVGGAYKPGQGFGIISAHTDSPCLQVKPLSERVKEGFVELAVQTYGDGLWYTWFDRDLTLAGRCIVHNPTTGALEERLVHFDRPLACVPSLAIHLNRNVTKNFAPDPEINIAPILCTTLTEQLNAPADVIVPPGHPAGLMRLLADELQCAPSDLVELELYLADTQPARIGGLHKEFIHAPRLDNQFSAFTSIRALVNSVTSLKEDSFVRVVCLYDHEELRSYSFKDANSVYTEYLFRRVVDALVANAAETSESPSINSGVTDIASCNGAAGFGVDRCLFERTMACSFLLSADQVHAVHPSWPERHECGPKPGFHRGMVIKHHSSERCATNGLTSAIVKEIAKRTDVPLQEFVEHQTSGSTLGQPAVASHLGVMTADVGAAQLAMHSCRELTCTSSVGQAIALFTGFFEHLAGILSAIIIAVK